ncbi:monovalent cation:proton antiporter family protein [Mechercharimyces sp. CAU 1602]|uniref:monovalent cation:proton antiporter family protein n=1 Tax=Mechercharimyces sp. CAU 1602 TaxID=2973933 RepID=UPI002163E078|nr:monovalent cation:proton antiporter family protein [Mechercharimyces sp. CAU 1602]MCS1352197.1 monovalent cation:proton antiporter family protein [Mechercharimyces sp. CAU 1602]
MEGTHSVTSLMVVVIVAFLIPIVLHRLKLKFIPVVVAEIIAGIVLGQSGFQVIHEDQFLELLSTLGIIYLMFLSGLEIDFDLIQKSNKKKDKKAGNPLIISVVSFFTILFLSFGMAWGIQALGFVDDVLFMTLIISTISVSIALPILKDKGFLDTTYGQAILLTAVIADFVTMLLLAIHISLIRSGESVFNTLWLLLLFVAFFVVYRMIQIFKPFKLVEKIKLETISISTRGVFALILLFVALSEGVGAENILGAFLAGVILSLMYPSKPFVKQLNAFGYGFLIPIFFVMVGAELDLKGLLQEPSALLMLPILLFAAYFSRVLVILLFRRWFNMKQSIGAGLLLSSQLSLVIAAAAIGIEMKIIDETMNTALVLAAVLTTLISPILFQKILPDREKEQRHTVSLVGINLVTLTLAQDLFDDKYQVTVYGSDKSNLESDNERPYPIVQLPVIDEESLEAEGVIDSDIVVFFTNDDEKNVRLACWAEKEGVEQVIARMEDKANLKLPKESAIHLFSSFSANKTLLLSLIEHPSMIKMVSDKESHMQEIPLCNERFHERRVRDLPFLGDTLIIRVFRGDEVILPHGETLLLLGDRLIISGTPEHVQRLREMLK